MIKLIKNYTPLCLNPVAVRDLTNDFIATNKNVWDIPDLKKALLDSSFNKCAYCECDINEESKYMEVEHFLYKDKYPNHVVSWDNLLPSCKRCNIKKRTHDVILEPIVHPYRQEPNDHLSLRLYRYKPKTQIGKSTIEVLDLNNTERLVRKRFEIGEAIHKNIDDALLKLENYISSSTTRNKNRIISHVEGLLLECQPSSEYSATSATVLHNDVDYDYLRVNMQNSGLWDSDLEDLHTKSFASVMN